jgi:hypothetical protein
MNKTYKINATPEQLDEVLKIQKEEGGDFWTILKERFGVEPVLVERFVKQTFRYYDA